MMRPVPSAARRKSISRRAWGKAAPAVALPGAAMAVPAAMAAGPGAPATAAAPAASNRTSKAFPSICIWYAEGRTRFSTTRVRSPASATVTVRRLPWFTSTKPPLRALDTPAKSSAILGGVWTAKPAGRRTKGWLNSILTTSTPPCREVLTACRLAWAQASAGPRTSSGAKAKARIRARARNRPRVQAGTVPCGSVVIACPPGSAAKRCAPPTRQRHPARPRAAQACPLQSSRRGRCSAPCSLPPSLDRATCRR